MSETLNLSTSPDIELNKSTELDYTRHQPRGCFYFVLLFIVGQLYCGLYSSLGMFVTQLSSHNLNMPFFNSFLCTAVVLAYAKSMKPQKNTNVHFIDYLVPTIFDSLCMILNQVAYSETSMASNDLMNSFSILVVTILSIIVFKLTYTYTHYLGIAFTLAGMGVIYYLDSKNGGLSVGDLFGLLSSTCQAFSVVFQERVFAKGMQTHEYLAKSMVIESVIGICGFLLTSEYQIMLQGNFTLIAILEISAYAVVNLVVIILLIYILQNYGATSFSLISLFSVVYSMLFDVYLFGKPFHFLEVVGYASIITGVVVFHIMEPYTSKKDPLLGGEGQ